MMTELGKVLRTIRIQHGEILKVMSDNLGVTSSYLSAVENGKRPMPENWPKKIGQIYNLSEAKIKEIRDCADRLATSVKINMDGANAHKREAALIFARAFDNMDEKTAISIKQFLEKDGV